MLATAAPVCAHATTYYVNSATGSDRNPGTEAAPWRTLHRVERSIFSGGDTILLRAGQSFAGSLQLATANLRDSAVGRPLTLESYGRGHASIEAGSSSAIVAKNVSGIRVRNLELVGSNSSCSRETDGVALIEKAASGALIDGFSVEGVNAHGFCNGVAVGTLDNSRRIENVTVADSQLHDNGNAGLMTFDPAEHRLDVHDVTVDDVTAYRNDGVGGIAIFGARDALVENSTAYENGRGQEGAVGIWTFNADWVRIEHDTSYRNESDGGDGDGFDLDGGVSNSTLAYDDAYDNEGMGFLVCACILDGGYAYYSSHDDTVAHDTSTSDGTDGQPSGLYVLGGDPFTNLSVYDNSFSSDVGSGPEILIEDEPDGAPYRGITLADNAIDSSKVLLEIVRAGKALSVSGNTWSGTGGFRWEGNEYLTFAEMSQRCTCLGRRRDPPRAKSISMRGVERATRWRRTA